MELGLVGVVVVLAAVAACQVIQRRRIARRFAGIADIEHEIAERRRRANEEIDSAKRTATHEVASAMREAAELRDRQAGVRAAYDKLCGDLARLGQQAEAISYGLYEPVFALDTTAEYKQRLVEVRDLQKAMIRDDAAVTATAVWAVGDCRDAGERMQKQCAKLLLRTFNSECDAIVARVAWNNAVRMIERVHAAFEAINKLGDVMELALAPGYKALKLDELRLEHELQQKRREEQEEQRALREQLREEELAQAEAEAAARHADEAEHALAAGYSDALALAAADARAACDRALARSQSGAGHVFILSNVGSFGDKLYKIGMTRSEHPLERIRELGDAATPFPFDIHALIPTDDAAALEDRLHRQFADRRVNTSNPHTGFFQVTLDELEAAVRAEGLTVRLTRIAEAQQYRESLERRRSASRRALTSAEIPYSLGL